MNTLKKKTMDSCAQYSHSIAVYVDGEMRSFHALDDDWGSSFRDSGRHWLRWLHTGDGPLLWSGEEAVDVLRFALAAYASSAAGGIGVDPATVTEGLIE